jgi:cytochrome c551/c552
MKTAVLVAAAAACLLVSGTAFADQDVFAKNNCTLCHKPDTKGVGPSVQDIVGKFKDDADGAKKIEDVIKNGSKGAWGENSMMAPQAAVSADDAKAIAEWIMSSAAGK